MMVSFILVVLLICKHLRRYFRGNMPLLRSLPFGVA